MMKSIFVAASMMIAAPVMAQTTTSKTFANGATVTNTRSVSDGTYSDQRSFTGANGSTYSNSRSNGPGGYSDTRNAKTAAGTTYANSRSVGPLGAYHDSRSVEGANGATYASQRNAYGRFGAHTWSGTTASGRGFGGFRVGRRR